jgi:hypothetical protein
MDITNLSQTAQADDRLMPQWVNAARDAIASLSQQIAYANDQISTLKSQLSQAFQVVPTAGLTATVAAGNVKLPSGLIVAIAQTTVSVPNNATSIVYISGTGQVVVSVERPSVGLELARVTAAAGIITSVQNYPIFEVRPAAVNLENYATRSYADSRAWKIQAYARKTAVFPVPGKDTYYRIPFESVAGTGFNTAGTFKSVGTFIFKVQVRMDTTAVASSPDLSGKVSLFVNNEEAGIALTQQESARADLVFNAENVDPVVLTENDTADLRIYLTQGIQARVRENSRVTAWKLP